MLVLPPGRVFGMSLIMPGLVEAAADGIASITSAPLPKNNRASRS